MPKGLSPNAPTSVGVFVYNHISTTFYYFQKKIQKIISNNTHISFTSLQTIN